MHLVRGNLMKISYLCKIEYVVYVPILPPQHTLMGTHRKLGINVRFQSPSIVKYLDLLWRIYLRPVCWFYFDNEHFQALGGIWCIRDNARKLCGMHKAFHAQDHVLNELNFEFKELLICIILQINCQIHLLITKVSFKLINPL